MKLLHTSDWHLGVRFFDQDRTEEFEKIFGWLLELVDSEKIDAMVIAGDIFDSANPPNDAVKQFYHFVGRLANTSCRHLIVVGGNHDSPSRLNAPRDLFEIANGLNIKMVGCVDPDNLDQEVIVLSDGTGMPEAIVCAVPYIHDRYVRVGEAGESSAAKTQKLLDGIAAHYTEIAGRAKSEQERILKETGKEVPIIMTGHLFMKGANQNRTEDDGVRELYVGGLHGVEVSAFTDAASYVALGHIHVPYPVDEEKRIRYSGSLLPIGFDETNNDKKVYVVNFDGTKAKSDGRIVPKTRRMERIASDNPQEILNRLEELKSEKKDEPIYFMAIYTGTTPVLGLKRQISHLVSETNLVECGVKMPRVQIRGLSADYTGEEVQNLKPEDVFERVLDSNGYEEGEKRSRLRELHLEVLKAVLEKENA